MNKNRRYLFLAGIILIVFSVFIFSINRGFRITNIRPSLKNVSTVTPYIDLSFSQPVSNSGLYIYSVQNIVASYKLNGSSTVRVFLNIPLQVSTLYQITIRSVSSVSSSTIKNQTLSFKAVYVPSNLLPKEQTKYLTSIQDKPASEIYGTTLVNSLPYLAPASEFLINYDIINQKPYITIASGSQQGIKDANLWITNQGYDITKLNIKYYNQSP
jgi:hypothetical protein